MPEFITEGTNHKQEVEVTVSAQARRILQQANLSETDFLTWALEENKISFGGHHVMLYMEKQYEKTGGKP